MHDCTFPSRSRYGKHSTPTRLAFPSLEATANNEVFCRQIEDCVLQMLGQLAICHVAGAGGDYGPEGNVEWKDVGIFSDAEWAVIMRSCLSSMSM